ncbi:hypothetical protein CP556_18460 [Natrinema sp. CBA1119]|uniref:HNH endonuclease n=1 Tax=Natrinema sp. CBA1119 TaxID=1608465 RepID=UPI000BF93C07|nr:HNH endonuclease [Natrinema sp. CBA1119]PGF17890.1 hypothetical protein CP556_18460 [Natrinema sp. CBA1119]
MGKKYPSDWDRRRKEVYKRDNYTCQSCGARGGPHGDAELHAHHSLAISKGGPHKKSNLITHCEECHRKIHNNSSTGRTTARKITIENSTTFSERQEYWIYTSIILSPAILILISSLYSGSIRLIIIGTITSVIFTGITIYICGATAYENYTALKTIDSSGRWDYTMELMEDGQQCLEQKEWLEAKRYFRRASESYARIYKNNKNENSLESQAAKQWFEVAKRRSYMCSDLYKGRNSRAKAEQKRANKLTEEIHQSSLND